MNRIPHSNNQSSESFQSIDHNLVSKMHFYHLCFFASVHPGSIASTLYTKASNCEWATHKELQ